MTTRVAEVERQSPPRARAAPAEADLVYFSSVSGNTRRFVEKLDRPAAQIPLRPRLEGTLRATRPFVLVVPTYGSGRRSGAVPKQVITFLNDPDNRQLLRGVIAAGNTNFGEDYCLAGPVISAKCRVPVLYRFELLGTPRRRPPRRGRPRPLLGGHRPRRARCRRPSRVRLIHPCPEGLP
ncbi:Ribonucleotide reduction protein NrdI [Brachybacterium faecium]|nr:Ribonucleotide reduction protein NrdI [Brachybacterium faecium]